VRINYPINKLDSTIYQLPFAGGYKTKIPANINIESKYGRFLEQYQQKGSEIYVSRSFQLFSGEYPKEEYALFYAFIESIKEAQKKSPIVLNPL
jgi:hypothetical protein